MNNLVRAFAHKPDMPCSLHFLLSPHNDPVSFEHSIDYHKDSKFFAFPPQNILGPKSHMVRSISKEYILELITILVCFFVAEIRPWLKSTWVWKCLLPLMNHSLSPREANVGAQGRKPEAGIEAKTMNEFCLLYYLQGLLLCLSYIAQVIRVSLFIEG